MSSVTMIPLLCRRILAWGAMTVTLLLLLHVEQHDINRVSAFGISNGRQQRMDGIAKAVSSVVNNDGEMMMGGNSIDDTNSNNSSSNEGQGRREVLKSIAGVVSASAASALMTTVTVPVLPAFAAEDTGLGDISMPSEDDQKKAEADAAAERLRIKAELQKKSAKPASFKESFAAEQAKQKSLQKTKEEKRAALCEELGRGC